MLLRKRRKSRLLPETSKRAPMGSSSSDLPVKPTKKKTEQTMQQITQSVPGNKKKMSSKQEICTNSRMKKSKGKKTSFSRERDINGHGYQLKVKYTPAHITLKKAIFTWISLVEIGLIVTAAAVLIIEIAVLPG